MTDVDMTPPPTNDPPAGDPPAAPAPTPEDVAAEAAKWKELARKHERENTKTMKELEQLRQQSMSDSDKAIAAARDEGRNEALKDLGKRMVAAEFRVALTGRNADVSSVLDGINDERFLDETGQPDVEKITKFVDKNWPAGDRIPPGRPGPRSSADRPTDMNDIIRRNLRGGA